MDHLLNPFFEGGLFFRRKRNVFGEKMYQI
jgi:hypothetical protein